jgi:predicted Zn-dependent protease
MDINALNKMLISGQDNLLLRFALAQALFKQDQFEDAIPHLEQALEHDSTHTASLKLLGKAFAACDKKEKAMEIYREGIEIAEDKGDIQAAKEMRVFLKRLMKNSSSPADS